MARRLLVFVEMVHQRCRGLRSYAKSQHCPEPRGLRVEQTQRCFRNLTNQDLTAPLAWALPLKDEIHTVNHSTVNWNALILGNSVIHEDPLPARLSPGHLDRCSASYRGKLVHLKAMEAPWCAGPLLWNPCMAKGRLFAGLNQGVPGGLNAVRIANT